MVEVNTAGEENELRAKRKSDLPPSINETGDEEKNAAESNKKQKLETPFSNSKNDDFSPASEEKIADLKQTQNVAPPEDDDDDEEDYEGEDEDEDEGDEDEQSNGEEEIANSKGKGTAKDFKGKGIAKDVKGKGKLIEVSEDDDSSELSGVDSDLSDDPLAEVDLDNILPSRTRRRAVQPGLHITNDRNQGSDA